MGTTPGVVLSVSDAADIWQSRGRDEDPCSATRRMSCGAPPKRNDRMQAN